MNNLCDCGMSHYFQVKLSDTDLSWVIMNCHDLQGLHGSAIAAISVQ